MIGGFILVYLEVLALAGVGVAMRNAWNWFTNC